MQFQFSSSFSFIDSNTSLPVSVNLYNLPFLASSFIHSTISLLLSSLKILEIWFVLIPLSFAMFVGILTLFPIDFKVFYLYFEISTYEVNFKSSSSFCDMLVYYIFHNIKCFVLLYVLPMVIFNTINIIFFHFFIILFSLFKFCYMFICYFIVVYI